jgi:membrane protease YdiL (CAAX protease family)
LEHRWLLPALLAGGLLIWQIAGKFRWKVAFDTYLGMFAESALFGLCLVAIGHLVQQAFRRTGGELLTVGPISPEAWKRAVGFVGAGIYEEFLFRLCLLPLLVAGLRVTRLPAPIAIVVAVVANSALFSAAHYIGPAGEPFEQFSFLFRAVAGSYFAVLCLSRGFGITVGAHAAYDLLVGLSLATPGT